MDIHVDIRGFLEIHAWICYGFSDQGFLMKTGVMNFVAHNRGITDYCAVWAAIFIVYWPTSKSIPSCRKVITKKPNAVRS